jgi:hypothetical protein
MNTILYLGYSGTSGYATATKNAIFRHVMNGHKVTFIPYVADNSVDRDPSSPITQVIQTCINTKYTYYDILICEMVPDNCALSRAIELSAQYKPTRIIIKTVWETTRISPSWLPILNHPLWNEVWVPSEFNKQCFIASGVIPKVVVEKYTSYNFNCTLFNKSNVLIPSNFHFGNKDIRETYNFYYISTWNTRKNNTGTLRTFCDTFTRQDNVSFLIKTGFNQYSFSAALHVYNETKQILDTYPDHPDVILFTENYSPSEISAIHTLGDCYFLLHRGEGLGLSSYDAFLNQKPVIVTGFGGHVEYFGNHYPTLVPFNLVPVDNMPFDCYKHDHLWAEPDYSVAKQFLRSQLQSDNN